MTDGTSHTIGFGEHAVTILNDNEERIIEGPNWAGSWYGSTVFTSLYPINPQRRIDDVSVEGVCRAYVGAASSMHPGGANFAMLDGSVRFLPDTINSWSNDPATGMPLGWTRTADGFYRPGPGARFGVYQALTTRDKGETIDEASYAK